MSYGKKDEDAELGLVKVDRTQVFQEGEQARMPLNPHNQLMADSPTLQQLPDPTATMPYPPDQDRPSPLHGGEVPSERSHDPLLRNLEAFPEQGCQSTTDGPPCHQGAGQLS